MGWGPGVSRWHCLLRAGLMFSLHLEVLLPEQDLGEPQLCLPSLGPVRNQAVDADVTPPAVVGQVWLFQVLLCLKVYA